MTLHRGRVQVWIWGTHGGTGFGQSASGATDPATYMSDCNQLGHPDQPLGLRRIRGAVFFSVLGTKFQGFAFWFTGKKGIFHSFRLSIQITQHPWCSLLRKRISPAYWSVLSYLLGSSKYHFSQIQPFKNQSSPTVWEGSLRLEKLSRHLMVAFYTFSFLNF